MSCRRAAYEKHPMFMPGKLGCNARLALLARSQGKNDNIVAGKPRSNGRCQHVCLGGRRQFWLTRSVPRGNDQVVGKKRPRRWGSLSAAAVAAWMREIPGSPEQRVLT